jgi:hypothetical protein
MHERSFSKSDSGRRSSQSDSAILHTSTTSQQATSSQANDEHNGATNNDVDIVLTPSQDPQGLYSASFDPHHYKNEDDQDNTTASLLHAPASYDEASASQMGAYALHQTDYSQYSPTITHYTWGTGDQPFITFSDTPIQYDTSSKYQDNQVQLQQWAYQTSNNHLTVAERLEKTNWETKRDESL